MNWSYISGFFDADGSIMLMSQSKNAHKAIVITFHNNDLTLLKQINSFIFKELGVKGAFKTKPPKKETHSTAYDLRYVYDAALLICAKLSPIQKYKRHKIATALKYYKRVTIKNGKYNEKQLLSKKAFERLFYFSLLS